MSIMYLLIVYTPSTIPYMLVASVMLVASDVIHCLAITVTCIKRLIYHVDNYCTVDIYTTPKHIVQLSVPSMLVLLGLPYKVL